MYAKQLLLRTTGNIYEEGATQCHARGLSGQTNIDVRLIIAENCVVGSIVFEA